MDIKNFQALWDNVVIKPIILEEKDGLIRPQQEDDKPLVGKVIMVSKELKEFKKGDLVIFNQYSATKLPGLGDELIVKAEDIMLVKRVK